MLSFTHTVLTAGLIAAVVVLLVVFCRPLHGGEERHKNLASFGSMADAIYWAEGGKDTRFPYGVKLYRNGVAVAAERPREMCLLILEARWREWFGKGTGQTFTEFVAATYCPKSADPKGHTNWINNVNYFMRKPRPITR